MNDRLRATEIDFLGWVEYQRIPALGGKRVANMELKRKKAYRINL